MRVFLRSSVLGTVLLAYAPAFAQQEGGIQSRFQIEQRFEFEQNPSLEVGGTADQAVLATELNYGLESQTRIDSFALDTSGVFRARNLDDEVASDLESLGLGLQYSRTAANAELSFSGNVTRQQIDTLRSLDEFINADGNLELPEDFSDLAGTGRRTRYVTGAEILLGTQSSLEFQFNVGAQGLSYDEITNPDLVDVQRRNVGVIARLDFTDLLTGRVGYRFAENDENNVEQTLRTVESASLGFSLDLSPTTTFDAELGNQTTEINEISGDSETTNLVGSATLSFDQPNGVAIAGLNVARDGAGDRITTLDFTRDMELPLGALETRVGLTRSTESDLEFVGSLDWTREFPTGALSLRLDRAVAPNEDDQTQRETIVGAFFQQSINRVSSFNLEALVSLSGETRNSNEVMRTDLAVGYNRNLTRDWSLNTGLRFTARDEDTVGQAESSQFSISIGREFNARR